MNQTTKTAHTKGAGKHPALALFKQLFDKRAAEDSPYLPGDFVPRNYFLMKCREAGIDAPENFIEALKWEEKIGLRAYARNVIRAYRKARGLTPTPMERGARRQERII
jgi:hypothetical protein